jgi:hypothetical protein
MLWRQEGSGSQADAAGVDELGDSQCPPPPWQGESPPYSRAQAEGGQAFHKALDRLHAAKDTSKAAPENPPETSLAVCILQVYG